MKVIILKGFSCSSSGKESSCQCRRFSFNPWVKKIPWRRKWQLTPVFLPGKSHGLRSLVGYSPWGSKESHFPFLHFFFLGMVLITASCTVL